MIYGTKLIDTDTELFAAALAQTPILVWSLDHLGVFYQVDSGIIVKYTPDEVRVRSYGNEQRTIRYSRETNEFSIKP